MNEGQKKTITSGEALGAHRRVKLSGATAIYADAGNPGIGVNEFAVANTTLATIRLDNAGGTIEMVADGAISAGGSVYPAADGKVSASINGEAIGKTLEAATADGDIIEIIPLRVDDDTAADSARSRAAAGMPTDLIWNNFNLVEMRKNPMAGSLLEMDFTHAENIPETRFIDTSSLIEVFPGTAGEGLLQLFATADNEAAEVQFPSCPITSSGGVAWAIEMRVKASLITDTKGGAFFGLMAGDTTLAGDLIADGGTLADVGSVGFQWKEGDGDILDVVYDKAGQAQNEHAANWATIAADTYVTIGLYYDGTDIAMYLNGVATGTAILAADIGGADFPAADILVPTITLKNAAADDVTVSMDWIKVAQQAA